MVNPELAEAVERIADVFQRRKVQYAMIGGLAVGLWSRPRSTKDADFIVQVPALSFPGLLEDLIQEGFEIDLLPTIKRWITEKLIVFYRGNSRIDWMQPVLPLYTNVMKSAKQNPWGKSKVNVATAEGVIMTKMVSFRSQDQADIVSLIASNPQLDRELILKEWKALAPDESDRTDWLEAAFARQLPS